MFVAPYVCVRHYVVQLCTELGSVCLELMWATNWQTPVLLIVIRLERAPLEHPKRSIGSHDPEQTKGYWRRFREQ